MLVWAFSVRCQSVPEKPYFNLGVEESAPNQLPKQWIKWGKNYQVMSDTSQVYQGKFALAIYPEANADEQSFGSGAFRVPAHYEGKQIALKARMKMENVEGGFAGLLLRIDGDGRSLAFDNMQSRNLQGSADWQEYTVNLPFPEGAKQIYLGGILTGKGKAWFDDFQLFIDGNDIQSLDPIAPELSFAEQDHEFDTGSKITTIELSVDDVKALAVTGKVWGFLKYYHPKLASGDVNWDYELFRFLPGMLAAKDLSSRNKLLLNWINELGPFETEEVTGEKVNHDIKLEADLSWIDHESNFSEEVKDKLRQISHSEMPENHYYIGFMPGVGNPKFMHENAYASMKHPDAGFRLLALYRYWNMIQYYFPYRHLMDENWDQVLLDFTPRFAQAKDEFAYEMAALELIGKVQDTHANLWGGNDQLQQAWGSKMIPIKITFVEEQAVVSGFYDEEHGKVTGLLPGDIILEVNNKPVSEIVKEMLPLTPASNYPTQLRDISRRLLRTAEDRLSLQIDRNGKVFEDTLACLPMQMIGMYQREQKAPWKKLDEDLGYIFPGTIQESDIPTIKEALKETKGVVIDLRTYPSTFIVFSFGEYLMPEPTEFVKFTSGNLEKAGQFSFSKALSVGKKNPDFYRGKVAILVDVTTQSQAEYTTMAFRQAPQARVFGSTTAGADGNVSEIFLPGGLRTMISGIGIYNPDGTETQRVGIIPDVEVRPTMAGIREGKDEILEKAIEWINATDLNSER